jgi:hypothetical protein
MMRSESPTARAFWQLADLARGDGYVDARAYALAWLAAGRMVAKGRVPSVTAIDQLAEASAWRELLDAGYPSEAFDLVAVPRASAAAHDLGRRAAAAAIVSELNRELGERAWDVLPHVVGNGLRRGSEGSEGTVVAELAALLVDLLGPPDDGELWIPFDFSGQLTIEALRRGWRVLTASPMATWPVVRLLLLTIEYGHPQHPNVRTEVERDGAGRPIGRADYALVMPPFGMPVKDSRMVMWDATGGRGYEQFARSESWAIYEFVNRVDKRAVFVAPQGVLFAKGQEQRLREYLLGRGGERNEVEAIISLPPGVFGATTIAGALLVVTPGSSANAVYMAELGNGRRVLEAGEVVGSGRGIALSPVESDRSRFVSRDEIANNEYSFAPSRYLRRVSDLGTEAAKLGDICEALRPPTVSKEQGPFEAAEVGMQDLSGWRPLGRVIEKTVFLKALPKETALVQPGDIVFSIKGTVGKAALIGGSARERPTVVSQSCLSLRVNDRKVRPEYLLMYLRSPHGQAQLEGLQVGAGVQHISPSTLLGSLLVPVPPLEQQREVIEDFENLCRLEDQVATLQGEMAEISQRRWPDEAR